jgi:hypothetical protein
MTKDEICGLLRQIHDVLAMQSETNHWAKPTPAEYAMGYAEGFNDACKPRQGEPVAWMDRDGDIYKELPNEYWNPPHTPIYAQRTWVGLTDEEIDKAWRSVDYTVPWEQHRIDIARAIEAKLKEKNT